MIKLIISINVVLFRVDANGALKVVGSENATSSTGLIIGNQLLIAHEVKQENKKNSPKISTTVL